MRIIKDGKLNVMCVDPGINCGVAWFVDGFFQAAWSGSMLDALECIIGPVDVVIVEDSQLIKAIYSLKGVNSAGAKTKVTRNVGEIDGYCKLIQAKCKSKGIPCFSISPKAKGKKVSSKEIQALIKGFPKTSNEHERDAAMLWLARPMELRGA